jgi:two-component system, NarL family, invasion response regulator UvrY
MNKVSVMNRILLADPTASLRAAFALLLRRRLGITDVIEAADLDQLDELLSGSRPDVLVLDWSLVGTESSRLFDRWKTRQPELKIIVMSVQPDDAQQAMESGACAFIHKGASPEMALQSLEDCLA